MGQEIMIPDTDNMMRMGANLIKSGFLPASITRPEQAFAIILAGSELGIGPMESLRQINIIQGKPTLSVQLMLALAYRKVKGFACQITVSDNSQCKLTMIREGMNPYEHTFTIADAAKLGLTVKD